MTAPVLHSDILQTLGSEIADGILACDDVLTLASLERRFNVSRTVVREVMRILESLRMVQAKRRVGLTVRPSADWHVLDPQVIAWRLAGSGRADQLRSLTQLRVALEPVAARLAADGGTGRGPELLALAQRLRNLGEQGRGNTLEYLNTDVEFHTLLLRCGGNEMFAALAESIAEVLSGRMRLGFTPADPDPSTLDDHETLARAVIATDPERAYAHAFALVGTIWQEVESQSRTSPRS